TIVSAPRGGSRLPDARVLALVKQWARAKQYVPPRPAPTLAVQVVRGTVLVVVCLAAFFLLRGLIPPARQVPFQKVAPAVVMVKTSQEHGTGFLISPDGWGVTNSHVIRAPRPDVKEGKRQVEVFFGKLEAGGMQFIPQSVPALVYKDDRVRDL